MSLNNVKAAIVTLGCKVNQYESDAMFDMLTSAGAEIVSPKEGADVYIVNTCSVTNIAERKSRQMLHRAKKLNPDTVVAAVGCYAQVGKEELEKDPLIDLIIGNNKKKDLISILETYFKDRRQDSEVVDLSSGSEYEALHVSHLNEHTRAYIKVQDGCNQFCSYCIIPYARGRVRSRLMEDILKEIRELTENGCREFVITGIHVCSYGTDLKEGKELIDLLEEIGKISEVKRIRLGSLEPGIITEESVKRLQNISQFCPHFHLSLQSGCDETLKRMNRKYTTEEIREKIKILRDAFDQPALTTDIIVGFPGETEEEFEITRKFLEEINLYEMHVFKYSKRKGTRAAVMEHQVSSQEKARRSSILIAMNDAHKLAFEQGQTGTDREVLIEEKLKHSGENLYVGHTKEYVKVAVESKEPLENQIVKVHLTGVSGDGYMTGNL
ncbi:tRNA (N(6)-L-threonylcarbamoyladenosine(37)-C(2))-methylthiotransferase MtaB [Anaerostipes sp.]|uniref:tRNA (N(6)-L-threonylcarbamoyladenosine(37)-C(2))- methylthiotransferase MtaB n=1 Tax=Anaerostipes sp. TaxID=1872530 RepID=UPI0025C6B7AD|nr:tRNA (N(6)-L-threonylcarbamoyladenosine(37)-C(2))-methylthiotransferase MtaB [Anaerostipes sp.]MBS7009423.1 tRNA (N(6)-L-threonylcarbamoyladenosine(37)-C(2))-methylthiotransferase MtaB [Anaerostipes sp.]